MLEQALFEVENYEYTPVTAELVEDFRAVLAEGTNGGYSIDEVLFHLTVAIRGLEIELLKRQGQIIDLETRILHAGLRLVPPE